MLAEVRDALGPGLGLRELVLRGVVVGVDFERLVEGAHGLVVLRELHLREAKLVILIVGLGGGSLGGALWRPERGVALPELFVAGAEEGEGGGVFLVAVGDLLV